MLIWKLCFHQLKSVEETCADTWPLLQVESDTFPNRTADSALVALRGDTRGASWKIWLLSWVCTVRGILILGKIRLPSSTVCFQWRSLWAVREPQMLWWWAPGGGPSGSGGTGRFSAGSSLPSFLLQKGRVTTVAGWFGEAAQEEAYGRQRAGSWRVE